MLPRKKVIPTHHFDQTEHCFCIGNRALCRYRVQQSDRIAYNKQNRFFLLFDYPGKRKNFHYQLLAAEEDKQQMELGWFS